MPRAERLSTRLDSLLEAVLESPLDPVSLYWDIAGLLRSDQLAQAQKKIRKALRQKGEIRAESAVLIACVLHLTGFPAHRILHFLSLYVPGGIRLSLFELAISAIFLGEPPIPASLLYDLTQYTYLEKRLLARRSIEISEQLRASLSPGVLLYLYLLSLRDDLSNENIQLIALIMKNCFPDLEVRTRIGGASLEEYGEIARAWKLAEHRSLNLDLGIGTGAERRGGRPFDRDSASFFLDKYFSDESLAEMRASAPPPEARKPVPRSTARKKREGTTRLVHPGTARPRHTEGTRDAEERPSDREEQAGDREEHVSDTEEQVSAPTSSQPRTAPTSRKARRVADRTPVRLLLAAPVVVAALVVAVLMLSVPAGFRDGGGMTPATVARAEHASAPVGPAAPPLKPAASPPVTTTYVVKPGDSLWKIFTSARSQKPDRGGWMDFLSTAQSMNSLDDPDRLQPGKVLTISVQK